MFGVALCADDFLRVSLYGFLESLSFRILLLMVFHGVHLLLLGS